MEAGKAMIKPAGMGPSGNNQSQKLKAAAWQLSSTRKKFPDLSESTTQKALKILGQPLKNYHTNHQVNYRHGRQYTCQKPPN
jgi:hypothetical protein